MNAARLPGPDFGSYIMLLGGETALLIQALVALITGKLWLRPGSVVYGTPARRLALIGILPLPLSLAIGFVAGFSMASRGQRFDVQSFAPLVAIELAIFLVCALLMNAIGYRLAGRPPQPSPPTDSWHEVEEETGRDIAGRPCPVCGSGDAVSEAGTGRRLACLVCGTRFDDVESTPHPSDSPAAPAPRSSVGAGGATHAGWPSPTPARPVETAASERSLRTSDSKIAQPRPRRTTVFTGLQCLSLAPLTIPLVACGLEYTVAIPPTRSALARFGPLLWSGTGLLLTLCCWGLARRGHWTVARRIGAMLLLSFGGNALCVALVLLTTFACATEPAGVAVKLADGYAAEPVDPQFDPALPRVPEWLRTSKEGGPVTYLPRNAMVLLRTSRPRIAFSPDGKTLAVAALYDDRDDPRIHLFDVATRTEYTELFGHAPMTFSDDGCLLVYVGTARHEIEAYDLKRRLAHRLPATTPFLLGSDQRSLLVTDNNQEVLRYDLRRPSAPCVAWGDRRMGRPGGRLLVGLACAPGGATVAVAWSDPLTHDQAEGRIQHCDSQTGDVLVELRTGPLSAFGFTSDGSRIVCHDGQSTIDVIDAGTGKQRHAFTHTTAVSAFALTPDSAFLAIGDVNGVIHAYDLVTGAKRGSAPAVGTIVSLTFAPDGRILAAGVRPRTPGAAAVQFYDTRAVFGLSADRATTLKDRPALALPAILSAAGRKLP